jgi:hypothetical protein
MKLMTASQFINNLIAKSEPYIIEDTHNIDIFILDKDGVLIGIEPTHKIVINNHTYYYTLTSNNWIYLYNNINFDTIFNPNATNQSTTWYGDHFSFGFNKEFPDILNFHLTSYTFNIRSRHTQRTGIYCDFKISDFIADSKNPKCTARKSDKYLETTFDSVFVSPEVAYIKEIIEFGLTKTSIKIGDGEYLYNGKVYKIQEGKRGGLFIMVLQDDGTEKKVRISKDSLQKTHTDTNVENNTSIETIPTQDEQKQEQQQVYNTRLRKKKLTESEETKHVGGGSYTYKFKKLLGQFILKFAKNNNIKLQNNTYVFVKQSTQHMVILFNYIMSSLDSKHTHQYILHANTQLINKYMSPGVKNDAFFKNASLVYV